MGSTQIFILQMKKSCPDVDTDPDKGVWCTSTAKINPAYIRMKLPSNTHPCPSLSFIKSLLFNLLTSACL